MVRFKPFRYIMIMATLVLFATGGVWGQSALPAESDNFLSVTGSTGNGDTDKFQVTFFEIPASVTGPIYFAVYDPGVDNNIIDTDPDEGNTGNWEFRLYGGTGTISGSGARKEELTIAETTTGVQLGNAISGTGNAANSDGTWVYFAPVYPSQGELIGNKYYFKVFATHSDASKNAFRLDVSSTQGTSDWDGAGTTYGNTPSGVSDIRAFAYSWSMAFRNRGSAYWDIYPFVPESATENLVRHFWDFDGGESGQLFNKDETSIATGLTVYPVTGQTNGTWRLRVTENSTDGLIVNTSTLWFTGTMPSETFRMYAAPYTPPEPDHVAINPATASSTEGTPVTMTLQIVDASGNPVPYGRKVFVTLTSGGSNISLDEAAATASPVTSLITTSGDGIATFTVNLPTTAATDSVTIALKTDGTDGSDRLPASGALGVNGTATITFNDSADPAPTLTHTAQTIALNTAATLNTLTITEPAGGTVHLTATNDIRIRIPDALELEWDQTVLTTANGLSLGGTASGHVNATTPVTYESTKVVCINLDTSFAEGETLTVTGLKFLASTLASTGSLELCYTGATGAYSVTADNTITVTLPYTWNGTAGNWSTTTSWSPVAPAGGPDNTANVYIPSGTVTLDRADINTGNLTIGSGATLTLGTNPIQVDGTLSNDGTITLDGSQTVTLAAGNELGNLELHRNGYGAGRRKRVLQPHLQRVGSRVYAGRQRPHH